MGSTDLELLRRYGAHGCEEAFAEVVRRHLALVLGVALRIVRDRPMAEEVAQSVFVKLAQQASSLGPRTILAAWLHTVARRQSIDAIRRELRRRHRETTAMELRSPPLETTWNEVAPLLDQALGVLGEAERSILVLRYLEGHSFREVASALGIAEDTAQKRASRALDRLRRVLLRRGASIGATSLASVLSANATTAAPAVLAESIITHVTGSVLASHASGGWLWYLTMNTSNKALLTAVLVAAAGSVVYQSVRISRLNTLGLELEQSRIAALQELTRAKSQNETQAAEIAGLRARNGELERDGLSLLRLRNEVGQLRASLRAAKTPPTSAMGQADSSGAALESWIRRVREYQSLPGRLPDRAIPELRLLTPEDWYELAKEPLGFDPNQFDFQDPRHARMALSAARAKAKNRLALVFHRALRGYAEANEGRIPAEVRELRPYWMNTNVVGPASAVAISAEAVQDDILNRYRIVATGTVTDQPQEQPILIEVAPVDAEYDTLLRLGNGWIAVDSLKDSPP